MVEYVYSKSRRRLSVLSLLFLTIFATGFRSAATMPQSLKAGSVQKLGDLIKDLERQYHVSFVYDASQIQKEAYVKVDKGVAPLEAALKQLKGSGISYKVMGDKVLLQKIVTVKPAAQNEILIRGTVSVKSKAGTETLPGIHIHEKGTKNGTATGISGEYSIRVKPGATIVFSMVGYKTREVAIGGRTQVDVTLDEDVSALQEVVVTGYQDVSKKLFTGAAATVNAKDVQRNGIADISRMLEGQVAGVSVQNVSGTFGAAPKIRVRGATSINGDNKPLWVVDGIILEDVVNISNEQLSTGDPSTLVGSSVAGLNPDDIESFSILKDASATALYGARAMNGVVVVTTKKGRKTEGKPVFSYTGNFSTYLKPSYEQFDIMNSADQMSVYLEMMNKGWFNHSEVSRAQDGGVFWKMYNKMYEYDEASDSYALRNDAPSRQEFLQRYANVNTNWFDVLFKNSFMQEHSLSVNSGTEKSRIYASTSYLGDNGWSLGSNVKRFTGNLRGTFDLSNKLSVELITQGSIRDQGAPGSLGRNSNPVTGQYDREFDINPFSYALNTSRTLTAYDENGNLEYFNRNYAPFNIVNELENNTMSLSMIDFKVQGGLKYKILDGLKYSFDGAYRYAKTDQEHMVREKSNMPMAYRAAGDGTIIENNRFLYSDPDNPEALPKVVLPAGGFYNVSSDNLKNYYMRHSLEFNKEFNRDHTLNLFGSFELRSTDRQSRNFDGVGYQYDRGGVPFIDPDYFKQSVESNFFYYGMNYRYDRYMSYMARASYSYKLKYSLNGTVRYDGSNLLGESRTARWLPTWNISGGWNIDQEEFFKNQKVLSRATLRGTYGLTASMGPATNSSLVLRNQSTRRPYLSEIETAMQIDALENSELTWEKQYEANIGVDLGFLNDRASLTVDVYQRKGFDLIGAFRTSGIGGQVTKQANYADMESKGIEVTAGGTPLKTRDFSWRTQFNFGYNKGKITKLDNLPTIWSLITADGGPLVGHPYRGLFSVQFKGLDPNAGVPYFINEEGEESANVYLQDENVSYLKYEGPVDPVFTGGFFNTFNYKNISLSALVTFSAGNKVRLDPSFGTSYTDLSAMSNDFVNRWVMPGDEMLTNVPAIVDRLVASQLGSVYPYNTYNYSTERVADGGFVRLKQVMLSYQLPASAFKRLGITNSSLSLVGNNLWLIYSDDRLNGQDPEFFRSGGVALPMPRQFTLSLKLGF